jgi:Ctr copper transporter family
MGTTVRCCLSWSLSRIVTGTLALWLLWSVFVPLAAVGIELPQLLDPASGGTLQQGVNVVDHASTTTAVAAIGAVHERAILDLDTFRAEERDEEQQEHDNDSHSHHAAATSSNKSNGTSFCRNDGMNMAMYMDGWHWSTTSSLDCLSYLVPAWRLDTRWKFHGALLYTFGLAVLLSAVSSVRVGVVASNSTVTTNTIPQTGTNKSSAALLLLLFLYAMQALLGYALMLVVMTYSIELLLAVIAGLVTGHVVWAAAARPDHDTDYSNVEDEEDLSQDDVHVERQSLLGPAGDFDGNVPGTLLRRR